MQKNVVNVLHGPHRIQRTCCMVHEDFNKLVAWSMQDLENVLHGPCDLENILNGPCRIQKAFYMVHVGFRKSVTWSLQDLENVLHGPCKIQKTFCMVHTGFRKLLRRIKCLCRIQKIWSRIKYIQVTKQQLISFLPLIFIVGYELY